MNLARLFKSFLKTVGTVALIGAGLYGLMMIDYTHGEVATWSALALAFLALWAWKYKRTY